MRRWGILLLGLAYSLLTPCRVAAANEYKIAVLLPEEGALRGYGELQRQGYLLAEKRVLRQKQPPVRVRYFNVDLPLETIDERLEENVLPWHPDIIVGPYSSAASQQVIRKLKGTGIPIILPSATLDELTMQGIPNVFRLALPARYSAAMVAAFLKASQREWAYETIGVFVEKSVFGEKAAQGLKEEIERLLPVQVQIVFYEPSRFHFALAQMTQQPFNITIAISRDVLQCIQITRQLSDKTKLIGFLSGFLTPTYRDFVIKEKREVYVYSPWAIDEREPVTAEFITRFMNTYRTAFSSGYPQYHNAQAYTALMIAANALRRHAETGRDLLDILRQSVTVSPMGRISFVNFGPFTQQSMTDFMIQHYVAGRVEKVYPQPVSDPGKEEPGVSQGKKRGFFEVILSNQFVALFTIIGLGLLLGSVKVRGVALGSSGVLFVALLFGHWHLTIPSGVGTLGLILFIYCVGLSAGPRFFGAFARQGINFAKLAAVIVGLAAVVTVLLSKLFALPVDLATGLLAGALTSTPALAAAMDNLKDSGNLVSVGYGIAYPFGVIGVVLFVQLLPKLMGRDFEQEADQSGQKDASEEVVTRFVEVTNQSLWGKPISQCDFVAESKVRISRVLDGDRLVPLKYEHVFHEKQILKLVGKEKDIEGMASLIGPVVNVGATLVDGMTKDIADVVVTSSRAYGKTLAELDLLKKYGVTITRVTRDEVTFIPNNRTKLEILDQLRVVGDPEGLEQFTRFVGHKQKALQQTDMLSLAVGMLGGVMVGLTPISIGGGPAFSLGLSGGLLLVSLILGHFGRIGRIVGRVPLASRLLMMEIGLAFFLASAGVKAGGSFVEIARTYGVKLFFVGACVTMIPMVAAYFIGVRFLNLTLSETLGGICGGMTSTPALGAIKAKTDSEIPVISYAAAYPVALILMLVAANLVIAFLR